MGENKDEEEEVASNPSTQEEVTLKIMEQYMIKDISCPISGEIMTDPV